jgi:hypothetical protein
MGRGKNQKSVVRSHLERFKKAVDAWTVVKQPERVVYKLPPAPDTDPSASADWVTSIVDHILEVIEKYTANTPIPAAVKESRGTKFNVQLDAGFAGFATEVACSSPSASIEPMMFAPCKPWTLFLAYIASKNPLHGINARCVYEPVHAAVATVRAELESKGFRVDVNAAGCRVGIYINP